MFEELMTGIQEMIGPVQDMIFHLLSSVIGLLSSFASLFTWPIVVLICVGWFRKDISALLGRIKEK